MFGEGNSMTEKWSTAFGEFAASTLMGRRTALPGCFVLVQFADRLYGWFRLVREEFRLDGVHYAFSATRSAVLLLRDMLAQTDLGGKRCLYL